jgi:hypothetical protein
MRDLPVALFFFAVALTFNAWSANETGPLTDRAPDPAKGATKDLATDSPALTEKKSVRGSGQGERKNRKRLRGATTEGTQAPNRFEATSTLKSNYTLDGQPLEVDPD